MIPVASAPMIANNAASTPRRTRHRRGVSGNSTGFASSATFRSDGCTSRTSSRPRRIARHRHLRRLSPLRAFGSLVERSREFFRRCKLTWKVASRVPAGSRAREATFQAVCIGESRGCARQDSEGAQRREAPQVTMAAIRRGRWWSREVQPSCRTMRIPCTDHGGCASACLPRCSAPDPEVIRCPRGRRPPSRTHRTRTDPPFAAPRAVESALPVTRCRTLDGRCKIARGSWSCFSTVTRRRQRFSKRT